MNVWLVSMFGVILVGQIGSFIFFTLPPLQAQAGLVAHPFMPLRLWIRLELPQTTQLGGTQTSVVFDQLPPDLYKVSLQEKTGPAKNCLIQTQSLQSEKADVFREEEAIMEFE